MNNNVIDDNSTNNVNTNNKNNSHKICNNSNNINLKYKKLPADNWICNLPLFNKKKSLKIINNNRLLINSISNSSNSSSTSNDDNTYCNSSNVTNKSFPVFNLLIKNKKMKLILAMFIISQLNGSLLLIDILSEEFNNKYISLIYYNINNSNNNDYNIQEIRQFVSFLRTYILNNGLCLLISLSFSAIISIKLFAIYYIQSKFYNNELNIIELSNIGNNSSIDYSLINNINCKNETNIRLFGNIKEENILFDFNLFSFSFIIFLSLILINYTLNLKSGLFLINRFIYFYVNSLKYKHNINKDSDKSNINKLIDDDIDELYLNINNNYCYYYFFVITFIVLNILIAVVFWISFLFYIFIDKVLLTKHNNTYKNINFNKISLGRIEDEVKIYFK